MVHHVPNVFKKVDQVKLFLSIHTHNISLGPFCTIGDGFPCFTPSVSLIDRPIFLSDEVTNTVTCTRALTMISKPNEYKVSNTNEILVVCNPITRYTHRCIFNSFLID